MDFYWELQYRINRLRCRSFFPPKFLAFLFSKPDHGFKKSIKLALAHAHIGPVHAIVKLSDDIQPRPHAAVQLSPTTLAPSAALMKEGRQEPPVPDQKDSSFFQLPPEIRNSIYRLASAGRVFHVAHTTEQRMAVVECRWTPAHRDEMPLGTCCIAPQSFYRNYRSQIHFPPLLIRHSLHPVLVKTVENFYSWTAPFNASYYEKIYPHSNKTNVLMLAVTCRRM
jgi:hypothetical protein